MHHFQEWPFEALAQCQKLEVQHVSANRGSGNKNLFILIEVIPFPSQSLETPILVTTYSLVNSMGIVAWLVDNRLLISCSFRFVCFRTILGCVNSSWNTKSFILFHSTLHTASTDSSKSLLSRDPRIEIKVSFKAPVYNSAFLQFPWTVSPDFPGWLTLPKCIFDCFYGL